jgi:predicted phosphoadenosine phosphosulfate sulfurtransferase
MRPKEPDAITENVYGTDRFHKMFGAFIRHHHPSGPACYVAGVRCEESAARMMGLTQYEAYQGETWGVRLTPKQDHFTFYPIYDWGLSDVWKAIHDHNWPYCGLYDVMYQYGVPVIQMRVSNLHHETAVRSLFYCQEVEPQTWEKLQARLAGVHSAGQMGQDWYGPVAVPPMFANAVEYRDYLLAHLIADPAQRAKYAKSFAAYDARYGDDAEMLAALRLTQIGVILVNDTEGTKLTSFRAHAFMKKARKQRRLAANGEPS